MAGERQRKGWDSNPSLNFAYDTLMFCEALYKQMTCLRWLLIWFKAIPELRITLRKNELIFVEIMGNINDLILQLHCKAHGLPFLNMGLPSRAPFITVGWSGIEISKKHNQVVIRKLKGRRFTMICSTLSNMSIHFMSLFCKPW